jgi:hypothetical protein
MNMTYGFQRLVLLNSAGYQRAELPLDASVSLVAPNNTGKTSLINALQYLLIIDKRRMDFGANDPDKSRRFYFPHNSAYILLEVFLPDTGTVVLGCVGKGVSHDYEYFAYQGQLNIEEYRLADGSLVPQPQLKNQLLQHQRLVFSYSASEFSEVLYGKRKKRLLNEPDFAVFKLEHSSQVDAFQRVLTRTLRLDKLRSHEVKSYLLSIFKRDLPDANIDFKKEWDNAFADVNQEREQYQAAFKQQGEIAQLEQKQQSRLQIRGKLLYFKPIINQQLSEWQQYFEQQSQALQQQQQHIRQELEKLLSNNGDLHQQKAQLQQQLQQLNNTSQRQTLLAQQFALVANRQQLETQLAAVSSELDQQTALVQQASSRPVASIEREQARCQQEISNTERELASLSDNLYLTLQQQLEPQQLDLVNRLFNKQVMLLDSQNFQLHSTLFKQWLSTQATPSIELAGLTLNLEQMSAQHSQSSAEQLQQRLQELKQTLADYQQQVAAAKALEQAKQRKLALAQEVKHIERDLADFDELTGLNNSSEQRQQQQQQCEQQFAMIDNQLAQFQAHYQQQQTHASQLNEQLTQLNDKHQEINRQRNQRKDDAALFAYLDELPHQPWLTITEPRLDDLADNLTAYHKDCQTLINLDEQIKTRLAELHAGGLTKFQHSHQPEQEVSKIIEFVAHLPQEAQALERKARDAVINVTVCLRQLRDGLLTFKSKMKEFNNLISRRQISDLSKFKIEPQEETALVEAINLLISTAEKVNTGDTFELFNQHSVLDDETLNRAKNLLVGEGKAHDFLRVEHLFRLTFIVAKIDGQPESFEDIDSAASNGTVLMAKLVTGLALLHLMQDKRHQVRAVCYLDEASALDVRNQKILIDTAEEFGFALIFASPTPLITARYCVPISRHQGYNQISQRSWQILSPKEEVAT